MGIYRALQFNTTTNLIDVVTVFDPSLIYPSTTAPANQNLAAGALVALKNFSGSIQVVNAYALNGSVIPAVGFVLAATSAGTNAQVFTAGDYIVAGTFTLSNVGQTVYLSTTTPGGITLTAPSSPNLIQLVGVIIFVDTFGNATISFSAGQTAVGVVTSVGLSMPADFIVSNSPITSSGTLNVAWANEAPNFVLAGPATSGSNSLYGHGTFGSGSYSGVDGPVGWRALVPADVPFVLSNPMTTFGDTLYEGLSGSPAVAAVVRLAGNITTTKKFLTQTGTGSASAAPAWGVIVASDVPSTLNATSMPTLTLTSGTSVVQPGAIFTFSGSGSPPAEGEINANFLYGVQISGTPPTTGQVLTATSSTSANWQSAGSGSIGGSIALNQIAVGSGSNTISGSSGFTFTVVGGVEGIVASNLEVFLITPTGGAFEILNTGSLGSQYRDTGGGGIEIATNDAGIVLSDESGFLQISNSGTSGIQITDNGGGGIMIDATGGSPPAELSLNPSGHKVIANGNLVTQTIASGNVTLGGGSPPVTIASGQAYGSSVGVALSVSAPGVLTTDNLLADFNADPTSTVGFEPSINGMLTIIKFCSVGHVNFYLVNNTANSITPGAVTLNWRVVR